MGNQYGYTGLTPGLSLKRDAYRKGSRAGRRAKVYDNNTRCAALDRFMRRYGAAGDGLIADWLEGWRDAEIHRTHEGKK